MIEMLTVNNARTEAEKFIKSLPKYPDRYKGKGIVIPGGGVKYFTNAWVCINMLRKLGCTLPIQLWYIGPKELDFNMEKLVSGYDVECVDARAKKKTYPARILNGWELKPYSIIHSPFEEVILIDADNVPVANPTHLFDTEQYKETGAVFWPDYHRLEPEREIWKLCGVQYNDEPEFETGQMVLNKKKCWDALSLTFWYNDHSDFFYKYIHGDKETFHLAFRKLNKPYSMPGFGIHSLDATMCQHDFEGKRIFQHRNMDKWDYELPNRNIEDFWFEKECLGYLDGLRKKWNGKVLQLNGIDYSKMSEPKAEAIEYLISNEFDYHRVGYDHRPMSFLPNGTVGTGNDSCEIYWQLRINREDILLEISTENDITCILKKNKSGIWSGKWLVHEKMDIELIPA